MKLKSYVERAIVCMLVFMMCLSSIAIKPAIAAATGNTAHIDLAWDWFKIGSYWTYTKEGVRSLDLYCAQHGGSLYSAMNYLYSEYEWKNDAGVWRNEEAFKKITWIKNNFWEKTNASEGNRLTTEQKVAILKTVDDSIDEDTVNNVFDNGDERFKLYQEITWKYTNGWKQSSFNISGDTATIYNAIIALADEHYNDPEKGTISITENNEIVQNEDGSYTWDLNINNTCVLPYEEILEVDGEEYTEYTNDNGMLTITGLGVGTHKFSFSVATYQVSSSASVWIRSATQNIIEITNTNKSKKTDAISTEAGTEGYYTLNVKKVNADEGNSNVSGTTFKIDGRTYTTGSNGIANVITDSNKVAITADKQTFKHTISEILTDNKFVKLQKAIEIKLKSGVKTLSGGNSIYYIREAVFSENGNNELEVATANGDKVKLRAEVSLSDNISKVTITVPNKERIFDLALTKSIIIPNATDVDRYDFNFDGKVGSDDATVVSIGLKDFGASDDNNIASLIQKNLREGVSGLWNKYYKYFTDEQLLNKFDLDGNGRVTSADWNESVKILNAYAQNSTGGKDRLIYADSSNLGANNQTTADYILDKSVYAVKKSDVVIYKIRVYNEGDYDAKDIKITDYLPNELIPCNESGDTTLTDNKITCKYAGKECVWTINGNKATTTISNKIEKYTGNLKSDFVYIACKIKEGTPTNTVIYNVAEISDSKALDDGGHDVSSTVKLKNGSKDRDSKDNTLSTETDIINKYKQRFEANVNTDEAKCVNKSKYNYQDDDDFERIIIVPDREFDLALRKSITQVGTAKSTMKSVTKGAINRLPRITEQSVIQCQQNKTGAYYHSKEYVELKNDANYVEYTIRVYNEGGNSDYAGVAEQITDYLPNGLEFYAIVDSDGEWITTPVNGKYSTQNNIFGHYEAAYDSANNKVVIDCKNMKPLKPKNYLNGVMSLNSSFEMGYYKTPNAENFNSFRYTYQEVKIICKVSDSIEESKILTNIAEITESVAVDITDEENGTYTRNTAVQEKDSHTRSVSISGTTNIRNNQANLDTYYEDREVDDVYNDYYPGMEDDDDFENILVKPTEISGTFDINLIKTIKGTNIPLSGAEFKISVKDEHNNELADVNKRYVTNQDGHFSEIPSITIEDDGKLYTITLEETRAPEGYEPIEGSIVIKNVRTVRLGTVYKLEPQTTRTNITNAKKVTISQDEVWIEAENTPEGPHKGVKEVYNQDSGYDKDELQEWVITTQVPHDISKYDKYILTDVIDDRLEFVGLDTVNVSVLDKTTLEKGNTLKLNYDYKLNYDKKTRTLKVAFIDYEDQFFGGRHFTEEIIEVRFNTKFALDANGNIKGINQSIPNGATLTYGNSSGEEVSLETETPEVHTGGVGIYKYDKKTKKALVGAKFKIAKSENDAKNKKFVKNAKGQDLEVVTNDKGKAVFEGLEFGEDAIAKAKYKTNENIYGKAVYKYDWSKVETAYWIVETEAPEGYDILEKPIRVIVKADNYNKVDLTKYYNAPNSEKIYDLSLRKFITKVDDKDITDRNPKVTLTDDFKSGKTTTANYEHTKEPVIVMQGNIVTYTMRVYNEGPNDAYAAIVKDDIPEGLELVSYTKGDGSINDIYGWKLVDDKDNEVQDAKDAKYIITSYLSKENGTIGEDNANSNLIKAYDSSTMKELDYRDVKVKFRVVEPNTSDRILINYAQIAKETDANGRVVKDRDSTANKWVEKDDDQDIEKIKLLYFDLALRKWVTKAIVTENGQEQVFETGHHAEDDPEDVVKVDLKKSKLDKVTVKFEYQIRVTNEGKVGGWAKEITDHIPEGLKFEQEYNPNWTVVDDNTITTDALKDVFLNPGESAEVTVVLTWINSKENLGVKNNIAEISEDDNEYDLDDFDSTPGNYKWGEDDIDDAPVMLAVSTGSEIIRYATLGLAIALILAVGVGRVRKFYVEQ